MTDESTVSRAAIFPTADIHEALLCNMTEGVSVSSEDGIIIYTNPAEDRLFGYEPGELIGQHVSVQNAYAPAENERRVNEVIHHLRSHGRWTGEWRNKRKDGTEFVTESRISSIELGGAQHWLCVQRNVSEEKRTENLLRSTEAKFRLMADSAPTLMWVNGPDGGCEFVNGEYLRFFGKSLEEVVGFGWLPSAHPDDGDAYVASYLQAVEDRRRFEAAARFLSSDGTFRWLHSVAEPRLAEDGTYLGHVGVSTDVTEQKAGEERQAILVQELNHRVKNTLAIVQSIAHQTLKPIQGGQAVVQAFETRLLALATVHRLLTDRGWQHASLQDIITAALAPFEEKQFSIRGANVPVHPETAVNLSLAINELATNAAKYGALSDPRGHVTVTWTLQDGKLSFTWRESDGPPVTAPTRSGFGTRMIERVLASALKGTAKIEFEEQGLVCTIVAKQDQVATAA